MDGELTTQSAFYGDAYVAPAAEKTGHNFLGGFDELGNELSGTVKGSVKYTAQFAPKTFTVTLVSDSAADGFVLKDGKYVRTIEYTYGTELLLPTGEYNNQFLKDYTALDGSTVTAVKDILSDITLTANWTDILVIVTFVDENGNTYTTLNCEKGDLLGEYTLPSVPAKTGHTGVWNVNDDTVTVEGLVISPVYTPITYAITLVSEHAVKGFESCAEGFKFVLYGAYGSTVPMPSDLDIKNYDFGGIYNAANEQVEQLTVSGDETLYINWIDNTVTVTLMSDVRFDDAKWSDAANGYCKTLTFNDEYTFDYVTTVDGCAQLGWWHLSAEGWELVTNVRALDGEAVWAVWISNINVTITKFYTNSSAINIGSEYNICGYVTGGRVAGAMSERIFDAVGMTEQMDAKYMLYGTSPSSSDNPGGKKVETLSYDKEGKAKFEGYSMQSNTFRDCLGAPKASCGGLDIQKTFTYSGGTVHISAQAIVTLESYTVNFVEGKGGSNIDTVTGHQKVQIVDGAFVNAGKTALKDILPEYPEFEGYEFLGWDTDLNTEISNGDTLTVTAQYKRNSYSVVFLSDVALEGFELNADGLYARTETMKHGAVISYMADGAVAATVTVRGSITVTLPTGTLNGKEFVWTGEYSVDEEGAAFYAEYTTTYSINYKSVIAFTLSETAYGVEEGGFALATQQYGNDYFLPEATAEGYTFLGWYTQRDGVWTKVTKLSIADGVEETEVEALWITAVNVTIETSRPYEFPSFRAKSEVHVSGGEIVASWASEISSSVSYRHSLNKTANDEDLNSYDAATASNVKSEKDAVSTTYSQAHCYV
ncbi:MAG: InlB B-repeat-containing protein, partial [Clostridiales bacterium]|nr:InlB B-repeat-containing protein [Clostridiales bacterium]